MRRHKRFLLMKTVGKITFPFVYLGPCASLNVSLKVLSGVLLNRSHQFHDLILAIDATEKEMFDRIDGRRTVAEIGEIADQTRLDQVRTFFEKLWRYDQVVFDISKA